MSVPVATLVLASIAVARALVRRRRGAAVVRRLALPDRRAVPLPTPPAWFLDACDAAALPVPASTAFVAVLSATVVSACAATVVAGAPLAVLAAGTVAGGAALGLRLAGDRADRRYEADLPVALELVARSLRSGASLAQALDEAGVGHRGAAAADLQVVAADVRRGVAVVDALERWSVRRRLGGVRLATAALALGVEAGGPQARAIDGVAATLRERAAVAAEARALSSQARYSALVITVAPLAFGAVTAATDARSATFLLRTPLGLSFLAGGLALDALAAVWMTRLTRAAP